MAERFRFPPLPARAEPLFFISIALPPGSRRKTHPLSEKLWPSRAAFMEPACKRGFLPRPSTIRVVGDFHKMR